MSQNTSRIERDKDKGSDEFMRVSIKNCCRRRSLVGRYVINKSHINSAALSPKILKIPKVHIIIN